MVSIIQKMQQHHTIEILSDNQEPGTAPKEPDAIKLFKRNTRIKTKGLIPDLTIDEVFLVLMKRKYPTLLMKKENVLGYDSSQGLSCVCLKRNLEANHIAICEKTTTIYTQFDFHCFYCDKIWHNFNQLLEHWKYHHIKDFSILNITVLEGNIRVVVKRHTKNAKKPNHLELFDPVTFKSYPSDNVSTFISANAFYNQSFKDELTEKEKNTMRNWLENTGEDLTRKYHCDTLRIHTNQSTKSIPSHKSTQTQ